MKVKVNRIYRYGNSLVRVADVNGDEITLVTGAVTKAENLFPAIPMGTVLEMNMPPYKTITAQATHESLGDESCINGIPLFNDLGNQTLNVIRFPREQKIKDRLLDEVKEFFDSTDYKTTEMPLTKILGEWRKNKKRLLQLLRLSPVWNEDNLCLVWEIGVPDKQRKDEAFKIYEEIMKRYRMEYPADWSHSIKFSFDKFFCIEDNKLFKQVNIKIACNAKPSRAIRKYFEAIGATRVSDFEKEYAKLSDALSEKELKRKITLSVHPMDYLRMSYGNSWNSCHHVGNHGCFSNGTLSYLMDESAMVCTLLSTADDEPYWANDKINRMMFFLNKDGDILQSRLYPQTRIPELEEILAKEVSAKLQEILKIEGKYKAVVSDTSCDGYVWSIGNHYHDYNCYDFGQNIWSVKDRPGRFKIGHPGVCVTCGGLNPRNNSLSCGCYKSRQSSVGQYTYYRCPNSGKTFTHKEQAVYNEVDGKYYLEVYTCPECGQVFFDKESIYCPECRKTHEMSCTCCGQTGVEFMIHDGKAYCPDCAVEKLLFCEDCGRLEYRDKLDCYDERYVCRECEESRGDLKRCEDCGELHPEDDMRYVEGYGYVCEDCYSTGDYYTCDDCGYTYRSGDGSWVGDYFVCRDCLDDHYHYCHRCDEYVHEDQAYYIESEDEYVCESCLNEYYTRCNICGEYVRDKNITRINGNDVCDDCYEEHYAECADCGEVYSKDDLHFVDGEYLCEDCLAEREKEDDDDEIKYGTLTMNIDGRFREGQRIRIHGDNKSENWVKIGLEDGSTEFFRFVDRAMIISA